MKQQAFNNLGHEVPVASIISLRMKVTARFRQLSIDTIQVKKYKLKTSTHGRWKYASAQKRGLMPIIKITG